MNKKNVKDKLLIKGPKTIISKLSNELFDELASEGFARVEGLGTFRKSGDRYEFIPVRDPKEMLSPEGRNRSKIVDLSEESGPHWLNSEASPSPRIPNAGNLDLSDVHIPSGATQQRVLQNRYEKHQQRKLEESLNKKQNSTRAFYGLAAVLAITILSTPFWLFGGGDEIASETNQEIVQVKPESSANDSKTVTVSTSSSSDELQVETVADVDETKEETVQENQQDKIEIAQAVTSEEDSEAKTVEEAISKTTESTGTRVQETKAIEAIGPELAKKEEESSEAKKPAVKVTPTSQLKAEGAIGNQYAIVAASMKSIPAAKEMVDKLRQKGFVAEVVVSPVNGEMYYRIILGRFKTGGEASRANKALGGDYWVTRLSFASQLLSI